MADAEKWDSETIGEGMGCLFRGVLFIWIIAVVFADNFKVSEAKSGELAGAIRAVYIVVVSSFPTAQVRLEPRFGENL